MGEGGPLAHCHCRDGNAQPRRGERRARLHPPHVICLTEAPEPLGENGTFLLLRGCVMRAANRAVELADVGNVFAPGANSTFRKYQASEAEIFSRISRQRAARLSARQPRVTGPDKQPPSMDSQRASTGVAPHEQARSETAERPWS